MSLCLPSSFAHDMRLMRMLSAHEFRHLLQVFDFALNSCQSYTIPARRREELRYTLGINQAKFEKRLEKWSSPEIDLIEIDEDGALYLTYLADQSQGQSAGGDAPSSGNGLTPRLQEGRRYSNSPEAERQRAAYRRKNGNGYGSGAAPDEPPNSAANGDSGMTPMREAFEKNLTQNLTPSESKPHASALGFDENQREVFRVRVRDVIVSEKEDHKVISDSGDVIDIDNVEAATKTSRKTSRLESPPLPVPASPGLAAEVDRVIRNQAVSAVLRDTGDSPKNRGLWVHLYTACDACGLIEEIWRGSVLDLAERLKDTSDPVRNRAAWLQDRMRRKFEEQDVFLPTQAEIAAAMQRGEGPEWVRSVIAESMSEAERNLAGPTEENP